MTEQPMRLNEEELAKLNEAISSTEDLGLLVRGVFERNGAEAGYDIAWEVESAVDALDVFASRWSIEILATLYIAGERRFNELRRLLVGISSRTLSDKLTTLRLAGLVDRAVVDGPPVKVTYRLTQHGGRAGRLLGPLVAYMRVNNGSVTGPE
jgi:DNA-binding HxlR family transcriptional regulator